MLKRSCARWISLLSLAGCAGGPAWPPIPPPRRLGRDFPFFSPEGRVPPPAGRTSRPAPSPGREVTLREALALALLGNPGLQAFSWEVRAAEARRIQAGLLPNPELSLEVEEFGGRGERAAFRGAQTTLTLSQVIQLGGKRSKRVRLAALERNRAGWDFESARLDVYTKAAAAFYRLLEAQERLAVAEKTLQVARSLHALSAGRVRAGKASPLEEAKASLQLALSRVSLERARRDLDRARKNLSSTWGDPVPRFEKASGDFRRRLARLPGLEELERRLSSNPDVARWKGEMDLRRAALDLAEAGRYPDLTLGGGIQRYEGTDDQAFVLLLSLPLMVFDRNQGKILEAEHRLSQAAARRKAALVEARNRLAGAYRLLQEAHSSTLRFERKILPEAEKAFDAARKGYEGGKFDYLQVLDAQRTLLDVRLEYTNALASYHQALVRIERLVAAPVGRGEGIDRSRSRKGLRSSQMTAPEGTGEGRPGTAGVSRKKTRGGRK